LRINENNVGHVRAAMVGALSLGGLSGLMSTGLLGPFRVQFAQHYGITQTGLGAALAIIGMFLGVFGIWHGPRIADRIGRYRLLKCSVGGMVIGLTGCGLFRNIYVVGAFWALFMLGGYLSIIVNAVVTDLWRKNPRQGVILLHSVLSVGKILGPFIAALLMLQLHDMPWRGFFIFGAAFSLMILVFLSFVRQRKVYYSRETHDWTEEPLRGRLMLWGAAGILGMIAGAENALASVAPAFYQKQYLLTNQMPSLLLTFHFVAVTVGRFGFMIFGGSLSTRRMVMLSALPALLIVPAAFAVSPTVSGASFVACGLCFSVAWPVIFTYVAKVFSANRSRLTLAVGLMNAAGIALGTFATSAFLDLYLPLAMLFGPAILIIFCGVFLLFRRKMQRKIEADEAAAATPQT